VTLVNQAHPDRPPLAIEQIPFADPQTFALLSSGKTTGLFQLESAGMRDLLTGLKPDRFEDIIAIIALYRPGPMDLIPDFIKRKQGKVPITYEVPELEDLLKDTYGVIVYQEQVMAIANRIAGFSLGQADILRRAMGKKKPEEMEKLRAKFIDGARKRKITEPKARKLFDLIQKFAGYGFNKSHAAAYAVVTYQTAYLKTHHPTQFMAALLTCETGNTDKIVGYLTECREMGIKVLPPDVNESAKDFAVAEDGIRFGLAAIKNVGEGAVESIIEVRNGSGRFRSFFEFCRRVDLRKVNKRMLEGLIKAGAFDSTGARRSQLMAVLDQAVEEGASAQAEREQGQTSIFGGGTGDTAAASGLPDPAFPEIPEWDQSQLLKYERELTGFYITAHPLSRFDAALKKFSTATTATLSEVGDGKEVKLCGIVTTVRVLTTKKGDRMAYVQIEDPQGLVEIIAFPDLFKSASDLLAPERVVQVTGIVDRAEKGTRLKGTKIEALDSLLARSVTRVTIRVNDGPDAPQQLGQVEQILRRHPGPTAISFTLCLPPDIEADTAPLPNVKILPSEGFVTEVENVLGKGTVVML
jgi:DNA polymerase-3 subunit alpha